MVPNVLKSVGNGVKYTHRSEYDFTGEFTLEFWLYVDSAPVGSQSTDQTCGHQRDCCLIAPTQVVQALVVVDGNYSIKINGSKHCMET